MNTNVLATAAALSDHDLLARLRALAGREREASVELVAHLAALDARPAAYLAHGCGSLFADLLASGEMTLTSVRRLGRYLTPENHQAVLEKARRATREEIDVLVAVLAPRPDARSLVRKLPTALSTPAPGAQVAMSIASEPVATIPASPAPPVASRRPIVQPTAPERYRVQFTIGESTREKLRRLQALLRREIPDGDPGVIFDRAVTLLLEHVENEKLGVTPRPRSRPPIRRETDDQDIRTPSPPSRDVPRAVKRTVWKRDGGQCAFVSAEARRCTERTFLEFHHVDAYAKQGPATVENISLRCRPHNQYEAELVFGPRGTSKTRADASPRGRRRKTIV
ncbi:MAG: hypothetical protein DMF78_04025 [Acidobacteria bacterium]|nr:MAG: hypothetical protein DMF78_04025 [Acidobacteriota bacterium]